MKYDVVVVGAGPVGSTAAGLLAEKGYSVILLEEHHTIGKPMQCGGLVSPRIKELVDFSIPVTNRVKGAFIHEPEGDVFCIMAEETKGLVIDRTEFDRRAAKWAVRKGVMLSISSPVKSIEITESGVRLSILGDEMSDKKLETEFVMGADGPYSITAKAGRLPGFKEIISGFEIEAIGAVRDLKMVEVFTGEKVGGGFFAWVIPVRKDRLRIGSGVHNSPHSALTSLSNLFSIYPDRFKDIQPLSFHGGAIPIGMREYIYFRRGLVMGDAAGLAKPISGGGIITGLKSATIAAEVVSKALKRGDTKKNALSDYQKRVNSEMGKELKRAWHLRRAFMHMQDNELKVLFQMLSKPKVKELINRKGDIDYPGRLAIELMRASPGLLRYAFRYIGKNLW